jgi:hypothetical protein
VKNTVNMNDYSSVSMQAAHNVGAGGVTSRGYIIEHEYNRFHQSLIRMFRATSDVEFWEIFKNGSH